MYRAARVEWVSAVVSHESNGAIRRARPDEADLLSALAFRSKAHWGYPKSFMEACRSELTLSPSYIDAHPTFDIELEGVVVGFYSLEALSANQVELGYLFVEPAHIGRGFGRRLMEHAKREARALGYRAMVVQGDPHAERFYRAAGGRRVGSRESESIPGRALPLFCFDLDADREVR